jgi:hypothetical protein
MDKLCKNIVDDKKALAGFGDFSQQHGLAKNTQPHLFKSSNMN